MSKEVEYFGFTGNGLVSLGMHLDINSAERAADRYKRSGGDCYYILSKSGWIEVANDVNPLVGIDMLDDHKKSVITCAYTDLVGSFQAKEREDINIHDWDTHLASISDIERVFPFVEPVDL